MYLNFYTLILQFTLPVAPVGMMALKHGCEKCSVMSLSTIIQAKYCGFEVSTTL